MQNPFARRPASSQPAARLPSARLPSARLLIVLLLASLLAGCGASAPQNRTVILATTTSTRDSGLLDVLLPAFEQASGYKVKAIAVGTGQALAMGEKGEVDVLLAHSPAAERALVEKGAGINRRLVMVNDFVIVGPAADPAQVGASRTAAAALKAIAAAQAPFLSRGDDSGTHKKELDLWRQSAVGPEGGWYIQAGGGMGQTLTIAGEKQAYTLTDRASYLAQRKSLPLAILLQGDSPLLNPYHVIEVNPERFAKVNGPGARALAAFLLSQEGQAIIARFGVDQYGQPLFTPAAGKTEGDLTGGK